VEDVIIKVDKFCYPIDFIVLDTEPTPYLEKQILVILRRPFLATANACINCRTRVMKISFGNMKIRLNIFNAFQNTCFFLDDIGEAVEDPPPNPLSKAPSWRNPLEPMPLTSSTPPPDNNSIGNIFHLEVTKVDFIGVDNFFASSLATTVFEDPHRDKRLIMEPVWDKHLKYHHRESYGHGAVKLWDLKECTLFKINGQRLKPCLQSLEPSKDMKSITGTYLFQIYFFFNDSHWHLMLPILISAECCTIQAP
jgi:hypothetical protein